MTRLLDGLERAGLVERGSCETDRRVVYAVLTETGLEKLREASQTHVPQVETFLTARFDDDELSELRRLSRPSRRGRRLGRLRPSRVAQGSRKFCQYRLGVGPRCPWYFDPIPSEPYGRSAGSVSWTNDSWPIFMRG